MNAERIRALADIIEAAPPDSFWMGDFFVHPSYDFEGKVDKSISTSETMCGTTACIAGYAYFACPPDDRCKIGVNDTEFKPYWRGTTQKWLDITEEQFDALCLCWPHSRSHDKALAVSVLRHFAETGEIDWGPDAQAFGFQPVSAP